MSAVNTQPDTASPAPSRRPVRVRAWGWVRGRLWFAFSAAWLVYLSYPLSEAWFAPPSAGRAATLVAVVAFGAVYLAALFAVHRDDEPTPPRLAWLFVAAEAVLVLVMTIGAQETALTGLVFVAVTGVFVLPTRSAFAVVAVVAVIGEATPWLVPGWRSLDGIGVQCLLAGMAIFGYIRTVARNVELVRARQELADAAVARERERMARDVHDILGHSLTVITVKSELAGKLLATGASDRAAAEIADVESLARPRWRTSERRSPGSGRSGSRASSPRPGPPCARRGSPRACRARRPRSPSGCASSSPGRCARARRT